MQSSAHPTIMMIDVSAPLISERCSCDEKSRAMIPCVVFSIISNLSLFSRVLGCISRFSLIVLGKTGSCFMVQQREMV